MSLSVIALLFFSTIESASCRQYGHMIGLNYVIHQWNIFTMWEVPMQFFIFIIMQQTPIILLTFFFFFLRKWLWCVVCESIILTCWSELKWQDIFLAWVCGLLKNRASDKNKFSISEIFILLLKIRLKFCFLTSAQEAFQGSSPLAFYIYTYSKFDGPRFRLIIF